MRCHFVLVPAATAESQPTKTIRHPTATTPSDSRFALALALALALGFALCLDFVAFAPSHCLLLARPKSALWLHF
jgi:hypothetical protein